DGVLIRAGEGPVDVPERVVIRTEERELHPARPCIDAVRKKIDAGGPACEHVGIYRKAALGEGLVDVDRSVKRQSIDGAEQRTAADDTVGQDDLVRVDRRAQILERL